MHPKWHCTLSAEVFSLEWTLMEPATSSETNDSAGHRDCHLLDRSEYVQANCESVTFDFACTQDQHLIGVRKSQ
jgi:hypothetical protein